MKMIEVKTEDLTQIRLNYAVAKADGLIVNIQPYENPLGRYQIQVGNSPFWPTYSWQQAGKLIDKYSVSIFSPKSPMHVNGGGRVPSGWTETGSWGATIFGKDRKHRRRAFSHKSPLVAAMRAIVQFELGDTVLIPEELADEKDD